MGQYSGDRSAEQEFLFAFQTLCFRYSDLSSDPSTWALSRKMLLFNVPMKLSCDCNWCQVDWLCRVSFLLDRIWQEFLLLIVNGVFFCGIPAQKLRSLQRHPTLIIDTMRHYINAVVWLAFQTSTFHEPLGGGIGGRGGDNMFQPIFSAGRAEPSLMLHSTCQISSPATEGPTFCCVILLCR